MKIEKVRFLAFSLLLSFISSGFQTTATQQNYFENGKNLRDQGNWIEALEVWEQGKIVLENGRMSDPRIGLAYIETVTSKSADGYYQKATDFYYWGLSGKNAAQFHKELADEAARIIPLVGDDQAKRYEKLIKDKYSGLNMLIKGFWKKEDPTPSTLVNERLIEHWERINYSRANFKKSRTSPYGTDDRGTIYVKYGPPGYQKSDTFGLNNNEFYRWTGEIAEAIQDPILDQLKTQLQPQIDNKHTYPEYEIWKYGNLGSEEPLLFIFAKKQFGGFGEIESIEELIPASLFRKSNAVVFNSSRGEGLLRAALTNPTYIFYPGLFLQLMLYDDLSMIDPSYSERYAELESMFTRSLRSQLLPNSSDVASYRTKFITDDVTNPARSLLPPVVSQVDEKIKNIDIMYIQTRLLDSQNKAKLAVVAMSFPGLETVSAINDLLSGRGLEQDYDLTHYLIKNDANWEEIEKISDTPTDKHDNTSLFLVDHKDSSENYLLAAVAENKNKTLMNKSQSGKASLDPIEPLSTDMNALEVSDLIAGVQIPDDFKSANYPFPVIPAKQVSKGDPLWVYLEVYHLLMGSDNKAQFEVEFRLQRLVKRRFRRDKMETLSQKSSFDATSQTAKQTIAFDIKDLVVGKYDFEVEVTDELSGQKKTRTGSFTLIE